MRRSKKTPWVDNFPLQLQAELHQYPPMVEGNLETSQLGLTFRVTKQGREIDALTRKPNKWMRGWVSPARFISSRASNLANPAAPDEGTEAGVHCVDRVGVLAELPGEDPGGAEGDARRHVGQLVDGRRGHQRRGGAAALLDPWRQV